MKNNDYAPYLSREDAIEEYKSLRGEIIESQKQRINLFQYTLLFLAALFGYFFKDKSLGVHEALFLVVFTIPASLFSYATRCRERRIAVYMRVFMENVTPWTNVSSTKPKLGFFARTSTTIVLAMLLINCIVIFLSHPNNLFQVCYLNIVWYVTIAVSLIINGLILLRTAYLPDFEREMKEQYNKYTKETAIEQSAGGEVQ